jgi:hypothetical protein
MGALVSVLDEVDEVDEVEEKEDEDETFIAEDAVSCMLSFSSRLLLDVLGFFFLIYSSGSSPESWISRISLVASSGIPSEPKML